MARIPYADITHPEAQPLVQKIVAERGTSCICSVRSGLDDRLPVELTATAAAHNRVSRFLEALQLERVLSLTQVQCRGRNE
jgi:hypothetical protein